jgi:serine/threonine-protein kinase
VYLAIDRDLGREMVLKILHKELCSHEESVRQFVNEARIVSQLQHPGIPPVHDIGRLADGCPFFVMKLVRGQTLAALLAERADPATELPRCLAVVLQACQTLAYAHFRGVIHRNLTPANVMVGAFGEVQVMGWGLAMVLPDVDAMEQGQQPRGSAIGMDPRSNHDSRAPGGSVMGTLSNVPPELARGELERIDRRSDVFGLGAILCEVLTGQPPFIGTSGEVKVKAQTGDLGQALRRLEASGAGRDLVAQARSCLSARPKDRPADAAAVANVLAAHLDAAQKGLWERWASRIRADATTAELHKRRQVQLALVVAVVLLAVACIALLLR